MEKQLTIVLPFPLPTWNRLFAMNYWERARVRHWLHRAVFICIHYGTGSPTRTVSVEKLSSMGLSVQDYLEMIHPTTSIRSRSRKKKSVKKKRKKPGSR